MMYTGKDAKLIKEKEQTREDKYSHYIAFHVHNVNKAFNDNRDIFEKFFSEEDVSLASMNIYKHDESKSTPEEFDGYLNHFYPEEGQYHIKSDGSKSLSKDVKRAYDLAWMHHYTHNKHHPEAWIYIETNPTFDGPHFTVLEMEGPYIIEMICDWESFSYDGKGSAYDFYMKKDNKKGLLHPNTRAKVEEVLNAMNQKTLN